MKTGYKDATKSKVKLNAVKGYAVGTMGEYKPTLSLTTKELPEIANWKVGETYEIVLKVKQTSLSQDEYDGTKKTRASFEIQNASVEEKE